MKKAYVFAYLLLICSRTFAQNPLFVSFESNFQEVKTYLQSQHQPDWEVMEQDDELLHLAFFGGNTFYQFNQGILYKISMVKRYDNRKDVDRARKGVVEYFEKIHALMLDEYLLDGTLSLFSAKKGRIYELVLRTLSRDEWELELTSRKIAHTPDEEKGYYDVLIEGAPGD